MEFKILQTNVATQKLTVGTALHFESWITGFVDGEGCFYVAVNRRAKMNLKLEVIPSFSISQKKHSIKQLQQIAVYFQGGGLRYCSKDGTYKYETRKLDHIIQYVLPHFHQFPLQTEKRNDFEKFHTICSLIKKSEHLNKNGLSQIIEIAYQMNNAGQNRKTAKKELLQIINELKV